MISCDTRGWGLLYYSYHSYLNPFEEKDYLVEEKFFQSNPNKGKLYNKIIGEAI